MTPEPIPSLWAYPSPRPVGNETLSSRRVFATYLVLMACAVLPFGFASVQELTGVPFSRALYFAVAHVAFSTLEIVFGRPRYMAFVNGPFTAALPFLTTAYQPLSWTFFVASAINDATLFYANVWHLLYLAALPPAAYAIDAALGSPVGITLPSVIVVSAVTAVAFGRLQIVFRRYDRAAYEHATRDAAAVRREERERISADLHDGAGASFAGMTLRCRAAAELAVSEPVAAAELAREITLMAERNLGRLRVSMHSLASRSKSLREFGGLLHSVANDVAPGLCTVQVGGDDSLLISPESSYHLLMIAGEALSNAVRHGDPDHIVLEFLSERMGWSLRVIDDGCGMGRESLPTPRSLLRRMKYLDARLQVTSTELGGTCVEIAARRSVEEPLHASRA